MFSREGLQAQTHSPQNIAPRAVDEGAGRCFRVVQVVQKLLANFVQNYYLTFSRRYVIMIIVNEKEVMSNEHSHNDYSINS